MDYSAIVLVFPLFICTNKLGELHEQPLHVCELLSGHFRVIGQR